MIKSFDKVPANVQVFLDRYFSEKTKAAMQESFVYMLRMFWQSRYDKMNADHKVCFDWISQHCLPQHVVYGGLQFQTNLISSDFDHTQLATDVFKLLYDLKFSVVVKPKKTIIGMIGSLFTKN
jgi:hypothetical protein